jgi:HAD superfamily hydrolase (TIGR01509 family)
MAIVKTSRRVDFELISGVYADGKPCPDRYLAAVKRFRAEPDECTAVEDSDRGFESALPPV